MRIIASDYQVRHHSYSDAISELLKFATAKGFTVDEDDIFNNITTGVGKPKEGKTVRHSLTLLKNGKVVKKMLHGQIYRESGKYELNAYIN